MPTFGFDFDSRMSRISLSAHSVSPTKTGFGSLMSVHARLAAAFSLVSGTVMPGDEREREGAVDERLPELRALGVRRR